MLLLNRFKVDRSANHCHLTLKNANALFSKGELDIIELKPLTISGEYSTNLKVVDPFGNKYTVLYPWRNYSQLEVAASDYYKMFKYYPKRVNSGDFTKASQLMINNANNPMSETRLVPVIVVKPHVHITKKEDYDDLDFLVDSLRFPFELEEKENESTDGYSHIHLDTDQFAAIQGA